MKPVQLMTFSILGNVDVGNGYGIPGGVAYAGHSELSGKPEPTDASNNLPEYLKLKLKARGILRDGTGAVTSNTQHVIIHLSHCYPWWHMSAMTLPCFSSLVSSHVIIVVNLLTFLFACDSSLFQTSAVSWNRQTTLPFPTNASTLPLGWV